MDFATPEVMPEHQYIVTLLGDLQIELNTMERFYAELHVLQMKVISNWFFCVSRNWENLAWN